MQFDGQSAESAASVDVNVKLLDVTLYFRTSVITRHIHLVLFPFGSGCNQPPGWLQTAFDTQCAHVKGRSPHITSYVSVGVDFNTRYWPEEAVTLTSDMRFSLINHSHSSFPSVTFPQSLFKHILKSFTLKTSYGNSRKKIFSSPRK